MKCFLVERIDKVRYVEDFAMVIIAENKLKAERKARFSSCDFEKAKLEVTEINMDEESCILIANKGA